MNGPVNFLTVGLVKTLIRLQIGGSQSKSQGKIPFKKNKVRPSSVLEINIVDELKDEAKISDDEEFVKSKTKILCKAVDSLVESDQETKDQTHKAPSRRDLILNLSHVTWMDVAGCEVISWMENQLGLHAVVVESRLEV